ncbi:hypothetical protein KEM55_007746, partial [Ascosphaera atra]
IFRINSLHLLPQRQNQGIMKGRQRLAAGGRRVFDTAATCRMGRLLGGSTDIQRTVRRCASMRLEMRGGGSMGLTDRLIEAGGLDFLQEDSFPNIFEARTKLTKLCKDNTDSFI